MAIPNQSRYVEWDVVTEATATNIPSVINTKTQDDPPVQDYSGEKVVGTRWVFDRALWDGTNFVLFFWRFNHKV